MILKLIVQIYGSIKPNIEVSGWLHQTKIPITLIVYQESYQCIPPYFMTLSRLLFYMALETRGANAPLFLTPN